MSYGAGMRSAPLALLIAAACGGIVGTDDPPPEVMAKPIAYTCTEAPTACYSYTNFNDNFDTACGGDVTGQTDTERFCNAHACQIDEGFAEIIMSAEACVAERCGLPYNTACRERILDLASDCFRQQCGTYDEFLVCWAIEKSAERCD